MRSRYTFLILGLLAIGCRNDSTVPPFDGQLSLGTWGGVNAGALVFDTIAHVHIGCTNGTFRHPGALNSGGAFAVAGSYILRAYPVAIGPWLPAQLSGIVQGNRLTMVVTVNDTVEKKDVVLGPVTVVYAREPQMGPCPICRTAGRVIAGLAGRNGSLPEESGVRNALNAR